MQEKRNSSASAMELRLSCTNPSIYLHFHSSRQWDGAGCGSPFLRQSGPFILHHEIYACRKPTTSVARASADIVFPSFTETFCPWYQTCHFYHKLYQKSIRQIGNLSTSGHCVCLVNIWRKFLVLYFLLCWCKMFACQPCHATDIFDTLEKDVCTVAPKDRD